MVAGDEDIDFGDADLVASAKRREAVLSSPLEAASDVSESEEEAPVVNVNSVDVAPDKPKIRPKKLTWTVAPEQVSESSQRVAKQKKPVGAVAAVVSSPSETDEDVGQPVVAVDEDIDGASLSEVEEDKEVKKKREKAKAEAAALDLGSAAQIPSGLDAWLESMEADLTLPEPMVHA